jgi:outer membrane protein insertion porin family
MKKLFLVLLILLINISAYAVTIDAVKVQGNRRVPAEQILEKAVKPGETFSLQKIDETIKNLYKTGLYAYIKVDMDLTDKLVLTYIVKEKPIINKIYFEGNDEIKSEDLLEKIPLKEDKPFDIKSVEASVAEIRNAYEEENYYNVKIKYEIEDRSNNSIDLVFSIAEGKEAKIRKINFYGVAKERLDDVEDVIQTKTLGLLTWFTGSGKLKSGDLALDKERIRAYYLNHGFLRVKVAKPEVTMSEDKTEIYITFRVEEGFQYYINEVTFTGNVHRTDDELYNIISLKNTSLFSGEKFQNDIDTITTAFTSIGYAFADVSPRTDIDDENRLVNINYQIEESYLVHIASLEIIGNSKTRDRVIRREFDIFPGDIYNSIEIKDSVRHLEMTGHFARVNLVEEPVDVDKIRLKINVEEQSTGTFTFGAGYSTLDGITGMAQVQQRNFLGYGYKLNLRLEASQKRTDIVFGFTNPWLFDRPITVGFDVYNLHRTYYGYTKDSLGVALRMGHPIIKRKLYMFYRLAFDDVYMHNMDSDVSDYIKDQEGRKKTYSFTPSLAWNTLNAPLDPSEGNKSRLFFKYAGGFLGGDTHYYKTGLESSQFYPLFWKFVGMIHGEIGYIDSLDSNPIPAEERYRLGGMYSVRGYKYGDISPVDDTGYEYGGNKMLLFNAEITFPLLLDGQVKGVVFYDAGQAYDNGEDYFSYPLKQSYGGGFRWYSPMGPLRLEYGRKINPEPGSTVDRWDFSIGGMF